MLIPCIGHTSKLDEQLPIDSLKICNYVVLKMPADTMVSAVRVQSC